MTVNIYICSAGKTRAFLLRDKGGSFPEVIGVGRTIPSAILDYVACFNERLAQLPEDGRVTLQTADILLAKRLVRPFRSPWFLLSCQPED